MQNVAVMDHARDTGASPDARETEWRAQHRSELLQQQRDHLQQLQLLHAQLITEVASELTGPRASEPLLSVSNSPQQISELLQPLSLSVDDTKAASVSPSTCFPWMQDRPGAEGQALPLAGTGCHNDVPKQVPVTMATTPLLPIPGSTPCRKATPPHADPLPLSPSPIIHTLTPPSCPLPLATPQQYRPDLVAKHTRHVEDLRQYYEGELLLLRQQLAVTTPDKPGTSRSCRCASLKKEMEGLCREKAALETKAAQLQDLANEFQKQAASSEVLAGALQERVDSSQRQLLHQEKYTRWLKEMLESTQKELEFCKLQTSNKKVFEQLKRDHEAMKLEMQRFQTEKYCFEEELLHTRQELSALKAQFKSQETQYKSTILRLEEEVRHLQHMNNRLNSLSTHYQFGSQHPTSDKATPLSPPPITSNTAATHSSPPPITSKITRRKWLEASDPGLICGGTPPSSPKGPSPSPQQSQAMAESTLRAIRAGSVIPDVKKLHVSSQVQMKGRRFGMEETNRAQKMLTSLQKEQDQLQTVLQKTARTSATTHSKQRKLLMEGRLEKVVKEIEALNIFLQEHH